MGPMSSCKERRPAFGDRKRVREIGASWTKNVVFLAFKYYTNMPGIVFFSETAAEIPIYGKFSDFRDTVFGSTHDPPNTLN